jgi:hypothetical protein
VSYAKQIDELQRWLDENSAKYHEIKKGLDDIARLRAVVTQQLPALLTPLFEYDPKEHPSDVAVVAVAEVRKEAAALLENIHFKEVYEERREQLHEFISYDQSEKNVQETAPDPGEDEPNAG